MKTARGKRTALLVAALAVVVVGLLTWRGWPRLRFWWRFESLGPNVWGLAEYRDRQTRIVFVRVPGGTFLMGAQKTDPEGPNYDPDAYNYDEGPVHEVKLSPFLIGKCEVSQDQWWVVMGKNPSLFGGDCFPVEMVSWDDCQEFCRKTGLRLPTEAQWEYACRAGSKGRFSWGSDYSGGDNFAWHRGNSLGQPQPVGKKRPNAFGLHDMEGNVWEWCEDVRDAKFFSKPEAGGPDPVASSGAESRVIRGGSWVEDCRSSCRSAYRAATDDTTAADWLGFRAAYWPLP